MVSDQVVARSVLIVYGCYTLEKGESVFLDEREVRNTKDLAPHASQRVPQQALSVNIIVYSLYIKKKKKRWTGGAVRRAESRQHREVEATASRRDGVAWLALC